MNRGGIESEWSVDSVWIVCAERGLCSCYYIECVLVIPSNVCRVWIECKCSLIHILLILRAIPALSRNSAEY